MALYTNRYWPSLELEIKRTAQMGQSTLVLERINRLYAMLPVKVSIGH